MTKLDEQIKREVKSVKKLNEDERFKDSKVFKQIEDLSDEWYNIFNRVFKWHKKMIKVLEKTNYYDIASKKDDDYFNNIMINVMQADEVETKFMQFLKRTHRIK